MDRNELNDLKNGSDRPKAAWAHNMLQPQDLLNEIHSSLIPTPYVGNLDKASIVLAMLNPGIGDHDESDHKDDDFRNHLNNQRLQRTDACFAVQSPAKVGFRSWTIFYRRFFAETMREFTGAKRNEAIPEECWDLLARKLVIVQLIPYYSRRAGFVLKDGYFNQLPSVIAAQEAMGELLRHKRVVIFRWQNQPERWKSQPGQGICLSYRGIGLSREAKMAVISELKRGSL
jgi:hypothetical protein